MESMKIRLCSPEDIMEFVNICNTFISDINVEIGSLIIDAKSIIGMFTIADGKEIDIRMISPDEDEIGKFIKKVKKFECL